MNETINQLNADIISLKKEIESSISTADIASFLILEMDDMLQTNEELQEEIQFLSTSYILAHISDSSGTYYQILNKWENYKNRPKTTTTTTTTTEKPKRYQWKYFDLLSEVTNNGLKAGDNVYVGATQYLGKSGICLIDLDHSGCYYPLNGIEHVLYYTCKYLVHESGKFTWIPSGNGTVENGAVMYEGVAAGRCKHDGNIWRVGKIDPSAGVMYYSYHYKEHQTIEYEALIYTPDTES
jgi:hypothetical protein